MGAGLIRTERMDNGWSSEESSLLLGLSSDCEGLEKSLGAAKEIGPSHLCSSWLSSLVGSRQVGDAALDDAVVPPELK